MTDLGFSYTARGEVADVYQSTPHSNGYYHSTAVYWANGLVHTLTDPGLPTFTYTPDGEGRVNTVGASSGQNPVTSTSYNAFSEATAVNFGSGDADTFQYDGNTGGMTQYQYKVGSSAVTGNLTWNANGSLQALGITDGLNSANTQTCNYLYDDLARTSSANCGSSIWKETFAFDAFGNIKKTASGGAALSFLPNYSNATNRMTMLGGLTPTYDANGNLTYDTYHNYTWDAEGRPVTIDSVGLTYDALGRMAEQNNNGVYSEIAYQPAGGKALMNGQTAVKAMLPLPAGASAVYVWTGSSSGVTPSFIQGTTKTCPSSTSCAITLNAVAGGDLLVVGADFTSGSGTQFVVPTDSSGQTWLDSGQWTSYSNVYYLPNASAGTHVVTFSFPNTFTTNLVIGEEEGPLPSSPLDQKKAGQTTATHLTVSTPGGVVESNEWVMAFFLNDYNNGPCPSGGAANDIVTSGWTKEVDYSACSGYPRTLTLADFGTTSGLSGIQSVEDVLGGGAYADIYGIIVSFETPGLILHYRHPEWLGSSRLASTASQGLYYDGAYAPYGEAYAESGTTDRSFTGQNQDTVGDLYDFLFREYHPTQGRWISPDPAGLAAVELTNPQSLNRYAYVLNNPASLIDPLGLGTGDCSQAGDGGASCAQGTANVPPPWQAPGGLMPIGPAGFCPAEFQSCVATLSGATLGFNGTATATIFTPPPAGCGSDPAECNRSILVWGNVTLQAAGPMILPPNLSKL